MKKLLVAILFGAAVVSTSTLVAPTVAHAQEASVLSVADAQRVSAEMGVSLESAVAEGLIAPSAPGASTYVVTASGAQRLGFTAAGPMAGMTPFQITAVVAAGLANIVGLAIVVGDDGPSSLTPETPETPMTPATPATP